MNIRWAPGVSTGAARAVEGLLVSKYAMEEAMAYERALAHIVAMTPPGAMSAVVAECERRGSIMTRRAAAESVGADLQSGRWEP